MSTTTPIRLHAGVLFLGLMLAAGCADESAPVEAPAAEPLADLAFTNGRIYTMDGSRSWAEAVAIRDGRIIYVGTDEGLGEIAGPDTRRVDLHGRMMLPAFHDIHIHPIGGGIEAAACDLNGLESLEEYRETIAECAERTGDDEWILGGGWLMSVFGPGGMPSRRVLDELVPDRPVYLTSSDGHTGWANSKALEIAGIDSDTPDPRDGRIDRDPATGEPIGSLQEGAMRLVSAHTPPVTQEVRTDGLRYSIDMLNGYGITSIQDAAVSEDDLKAYRALEQRGELDLRVVGSQWWDRERGTEQIPEFKRLRDEYVSDRLKVSTVKIMQDGVMENFTAAMLEPYLQQGDTRGIPMVEPDALRRIVAELDAEGFQVHFHAIGDAAIRQSLDAVEEAREQNGARGLRHHISHLELIDPADIPRFRELDVIANFQPLWAFADEYITDLTLPYIGDERGQGLYPIRSVYESGGMIAFGSDWSVSTANPLYQIEVAVTRKDPDDATDDVFLPDERINLPEALAAFTINGAWVNHHEALTGSIETGKAADLIVLDRNLFAIAPEEISETKVLLTLLDGEPVHGDPTSL
ncbi:MAG: amidohydrolase [Woeseia sp.]